MAKYSSVAFRGVSAVSALLGLGVIVASAFLLNVALGYRYELGSIFGLPNVGSSYYTNRYSYNLFGYQIDPLIGISAGGIVIGVLQFLSCFLLCGARRNLSIGWAVLQFILLIGIIVCFAFAIYHEVYSRKILPGYGILGLRDANGLYNNQVGIGLNNFNNFGGVGVGGLGFQNPNYPIGAQFGAGNLYDGRFGSDYLCNPTGQAYCALLGIDMVFLLFALIIVGCAGRSVEDDYPTETRTYHMEPVKTKV